MSVIQGQVHEQADYRRLRRLVLLALVGVNLAILLLALFFLRSSREQYELRAQTATQNIANALDQSISNGVEKIDLAIRAIAHEMEHQLVSGPLNEADGQAVLAMFKANLPEVAGFRVTDADGYIVLGTGVTRADRFNVTGREYFSYFRDHDDPGLHINGPVMGMVSNRQVVIFVHRYNRPDGRFGGVAFGVIELSRFYELLRHFDLGANGVVALRDNQLGVVARFPTIAGQRASQIGFSGVSPEFRRLVESGAQAATFHTLSGTDGLERTTSYRHLSSVPFYVNASVASVDYLAPWQSELRQTLGMSLGFLLLSALISGLLLRLLRSSAERERALRHSEAMLNHAQQLAHVGNYVWELGSQRVTFSDELFRLWGLPPGSETPTVAAVQGAVHVDDRPALNQAIREAIHGAQIYVVTHRVIRPDGSERVVCSRGEVDRDANGKPRRVVGTVQDITEQQQAQQRIQYLASNDALTGLPNRVVLGQRGSLALALAQRHQEPLALMFIDLDRFKDINDALGHRIGDGLLVELAQRLRHALRDGDTVSRQGGDEFVVLLPGVNADAAAQVAHKLIAVISQRYRVEQFDLAISASIGIAMYPQDGADIDTLAKNADTAMYRAKAEGRDGFRFFTQQMQAHSTRQLQIVNALRSALEEGQLSLHYQPQLSLRDETVIGAEALLRWTHPTLGNIPPSEFIPAAEDSGLILPIGEWVMRMAARQARQWQDRGLGPLMMAVNLSAVQFRQPDLPQAVARILGEEGLSPALFDLELTESVAMNDPERAIATMNALNRMGVRLSIDDFGTGYSSMSYLKKFSAYKLKIDQSFVRDISTDDDDKAIVSAVIDMARLLALTTIAEGVETAEQLAFLRQRGCDQVQGYLFCRPVPPEAFEAYCRDRQTGVRAQTGQAGLAFDPAV